MAVFAIRRTAGNEELICLANFSEYGQNAWLNCLEGEYEDLFTGEKLEMNSVWMNPYQYRWCVKKQKSVENRKNVAALAAEWRRK